MEPKRRIKATRMFQAGSQSVNTGGTTALNNIDKVINLCNEMIRLADIGPECHLDDKSSVFCNALRDSAYKIRRLAKNERIRHETIKQSSSL